MGLAAGSGLLGGAVVCWAATSGSAAPPFLGRSSDDANASPSTKAIATSDPNFNQSRVRTVIVSPLRLLALVVVHDLVIGLDHVLLLASGRAARLGARCGLSLGRSRPAPCPRPARAPRGGVERCAGGRVGLLQLVQGPADFVGVAAPEGLLRAVHRAVEARFRRRVQLVRPLLRVLLDFIHHRIEKNAKE